MWAKPGRDKRTLRAFFDELEASGAGRCARITHVSADGADWIGDVVAEKCPDAVRCADPFHVVKWATDALDEVRRQVTEIINQADDVIHLYPLCDSCLARSEVHGTAPALDDAGLYRGVW